jgi:hypothetical protein
MYKDAQPAGEKYGSSTSRGLHKLRYSTIVAPPRRSANWISINMQHILNLCRMDLEVSTDIIRSLLFLFLLARQS